MGIPAETSGTKHRLTHEGLANQRLTLTGSPSRFSALQRRRGWLVPVRLRDCARRSDRPKYHSERRAWSAIIGLMGVSSKLLLSEPRPLIVWKELSMGSLRSIRFGVLGGVVAYVAVFGLSYLLADGRAGQGESDKKGGGVKREAIRVSTASEASRAPRRTSANPG